MTESDVPLSDLPPDEKARRAGSFGSAASHYDRYRPGPSPEAVDWILPTGAERVVDLGAGTGGLSRLLVDRVDHVIAVEPDDRMRAVLAEELTAVDARAGRGDAMPVMGVEGDATIDMQFRADAYRTTLDTWPVRPCISNRCRGWSRTSGPRRRWADRSRWFDG